MASNSREARRRKILERGSDRLAFITGQTNDVPPPPPPPSSDPSSLSQSHPRSDESLPETITSRDDILTNRETGFTSQKENISDASILGGEIDHVIHQSREESLRSRKHTETLAETSASDHRDTTLEPSPAILSAQTPSVVDLGASQAFTPLVSYVNAITPNHIGAAIDASEYARMFSSLVIALLVISSHLGFSSLGNIVSFRPVFLLLLTDITIVLGRVLLSHHGDSSSATATATRRENSGIVSNGQGIADQVGNVLEMVMMVKKMMNAVSMDFSLYAVILICGLLFTQSIFA